MKIFVEIFLCQALSKHNLKKKWGVHMIINDICKSVNDDSIVVRKSENSMLVIAKKRIIIPENKIIVEKFEAPSLIQYKVEDNERYARASSGILLSR